MCGAPTPTEDIPAGPQEVPRQHRGAKEQALTFLQKPQNLLVAILCLLLLGLWFFLRPGNRAAKPVSEPVPKAGAPTPDPAKQPDASSDGAATPGTPVGQHARPQKAAPGGTLVVESAEDAPTDLWKRVRHGDANAEVALAKLYLEGKQVPQNCEQARLLLVAASQRHHQGATRLLLEDYPQRCR